MTLQMIWEYMYVLKKDAENDFCGNFIRKY